MPKEEGFTPAAPDDDYSVQGLLEQVAKRNPARIVVFMFDDEDGMDFASSGATREDWALASVFAAKQATDDFPD